jgi:hypothetical protein
MGDATMIGSKGFSLSGGQKQRIVGSRAITLTGICLPMTQGPGSCRLFEMFYHHSRRCFQPAGCQYTGHHL